MDRAEKRIDAAQKYTRLHLRWTLIAAMLELAYLAALAIVGGYGPAISEVAGDRTGLEANIALCAAAAMGYVALMLPVVYHLRGRLPQRFDLSHRRGWRVADELVGEVLGRAGLGIAIVLLVCLPRLYVGAWWPVLTFGSWIALSAAYALLRGGGSIAGFKIEAFAPEHKLVALREFARRQGFEKLDFVLLRPRLSGREIAAACRCYRGTAKIGLSDAAVRTMSLSELQAVVAHELAHLKRRRPLRRLAVGGLGWLVALGCIHAVLRGAAPNRRSVAEAVGAGPLVLLVVWLLGALLRPIRLAVSRREERRANEAALKMTDDPAAFISAMKKLAANNLVSGRPAWWHKVFLNSHPSLDEVVAQARRYAAGRRIALEEPNTPQAAG